MRYRELQADMEFVAIVTTAHRSGAGIKYQPKNDYYGNLDFLPETTLSFCYVIILLHSSSQAHKVVHASLGPCFGQHSASFLSSH